MGWLSLVFGLLSAPSVPIKDFNCMSVVARFDHLVEGRWQCGTLTGQCEEANAYKASHYEELGIRIGY